MGNADSIPVVSQVKSGVQLIGGDAEGAKRTQTNFVRECPGVSQASIDEHCQNNINIIIICLKINCI